MTPDKQVQSSKYTEYDGIAVLGGEDAERFIEYDSTDLTEEEERSLIKSDGTYSKYCKS